MLACGILYFAFMFTNERKNNMSNIKKIVAASLALLLPMLPACSPDSDKTTSDVQGDTYVTGDRMYKDFDFDDYIKLGQ